MQCTEALHTSPRRRLYHLFFLVGELMVHQITNHVGGKIKMVPFHVAFIPVEVTGDEKAADHFDPKLDLVNN